MTKPKRTAIINKLRIREISFVDEGDNPGAEVVITKRREVDGDVLKTRLAEVMEAAGDLAELAAGSGGTEGVEKAAQVLGDMDMTIEELQAKLDQIDTDLSAVTKRADEAEGKVDTLTSELEKAKADKVAAEKERDEAIEKAKADPKADDKGDGEEEILKALPEPIRKRLEAAEAKAASAVEEVEKARDKSELDTAIAKVKALGVKDADAIGGVLHRIAKGKSTPEDATKIEEVLAIAKTVGDKGNALFEAIGKAKGGDAPTGAAEEAQAKLDEEIVKIKVADKSLTHEQAYDKALQANPGLYEEVRKIKLTAAAD